MGYLAGYSEPAVIDMEAPREEPPSAEELMDANEKLATSLTEIDRRAWELATAVIQAETLADAKQAASSYLGLDA
jgi:hypothetical protein